MALTLIAATAASTDTGWTQLYSTEWTNPTLTLTLTGTGRVYLEVGGKRTGGEFPLFSGEVSWSASGSQTINLPTFAGKVRASIRILTTSGTIAVSISSPTGTPSYDPSTGTTRFDGAISVPGDGGTQGRFLGTYADQAAVEAIADPIPGDFATTRDGKSIVFAAGV